MLGNRQGIRTSEDSHWGNNSAHSWENSTDLNPWGFTTAKHTFPKSSGKTGRNPWGFNYQLWTLGHQWSPSFLEAHVTVQCTWPYQFTLMNRFTLLKKIITTTIIIIIIVVGIIRMLMKQIDFSSSKEVVKRTLWWTVRRWSLLEAARQGFFELLSWLLFQFC